MPGAHGIFVLSEIAGALGERIRDVQRRFDPKLARLSPPHVTLVGSSGVGPIIPSTPPERIREALAPIAATTSPMELRFQPPHRFMGTNIVVLPLDPHGPLRRLHDRIARTDLTFARAKFTFTPHATLSFFPSLPRESFRELLAMRFDEPVVLDRMTVYYTRDPQPAIKLHELPFDGG